MTRTFFPHLLAVLFLLTTLTTQARYTGGHGSGAAMGTTGTRPIALP